MVGSKALAQTWPTVSGWMRWVDGGGELPELLREQEAQAPIDDIDDVAFDELDLDVEDFYDFATDAVEEAVKSLGRVSEDVSSAG